MRRLLLLLCLLPVPVFAQVAPVIATTVQTTDTSTTSVKVGCAVGSSTCTGGISAGPMQGSSLSISGGYVEIQSNVPGTTTYRLYNNAGTLTWNGVALATGASLSGTTGKLAKFTAANAVGDSICTESGTTLTCVNTLSATTLTGTLSTASQTAVTGVGTLTTGTWNATKIGLLYGGTNADLSGTGGTSQFLRQNTLGGTVTVVRPAISDLSDGTNVALLNATNTFTAFGTHSFSSGGTGDNLLRVRNTTAGTGNRAVLSLGVDNDADNMFLASYSSTFTPSGIATANGSAVAADGVGGLSLAAISGSGAIRFYAGGTTQRWGINTAGDHTFGASSHIADSSGTPTYSSGFGGSATINGNDYAFTVLGAGAWTSGVINFGHTFSNAPVCTGNSTSGLLIYMSAGTTTSIQVNQASSSNATTYILCRGY